MPVVIMLDEPVHTDEYPYCDDPTCPCHADVERDLSAEEEQYYCGFCGRMQPISHFPH